MDPLNVIARSHDLALWGGVVNCQPDHLHICVRKPEQATTSSGMDGEQGAAADAEKPRR